MSTQMRETAGTSEADVGGHELVDRQWLDDHLTDSGMRIVEVDVSPASYQEGHIDGAVLWNVYADLKDSDYHSVTPKALESLMRRSGIGPESTVVFYGYAPALGFWFLKSYGHADVRILDCSRDTWRTEGRPWTSTKPTPAAGNVHLGRQERFRADEAQVREAIGRPNATLVDVRSPAEYRGNCFWPSGGMDPDGRAGHVPSAVHQPIDGMYDSDGAFRSAAELRRVFSSIDVDGEEELITYCTIGGRAATAWFVLTYLLGRTGVRVYDGSWAEWGRGTNNPVVQTSSIQNAP